MENNPPLDLPLTNDDSKGSKKKCPDCNCYGTTENEVENKKQIETLIRSQKNYTEPNSEYIEIEFLAHRKVLYCNADKLDLCIDEKVIVETDSGEDIGSVFTLGTLAKNKVCRCDVDEMPELNILRKASDDDLYHFEENLEEQGKILHSTQKMADDFGLEIKVIAVEWQFDRQRLTIAFSAPQRVDFRDLVKELARLHRTRIELRQISTREEAKRLGQNIGPCGRTICCSTFLPNFNHVTLDHAKSQQLSNNISKLSGNCVRLKCCLRYEYDMYAEAFEKYPPINSVIDTPEGPARILKVDIFKDITTLFYEADRRYVYITFDELSDFVKNGKVYVPRDTEIPKQSMLNPLSEFPVEAPEEIPEGFFEDDDNAKKGNKKEYNRKKTSYNNSQNRNNRRPESENNRKKEYTRTETKTNNNTPKPTITNNGNAKAYTKEEISNKHENTNKNRTNKQPIQRQRQTQIAK